MGRLSYELPIHVNTARDLQVPEDGSFSSLEEIRRLFDTSAPNVLLLGIFQRLSHCGLGRSGSQVEAFLNGNRCDTKLWEMYDEALTPIH